MRCDDPRSGHKECDRFIREGGCEGCAWAGTSWPRAFDGDPWHPEFDTFDAFADDEAQYFEAGGNVSLGEREWRRARP